MVITKYLLFNISALTVLVGRLERHQACRSSTRGKRKRKTGAAKGNSTDFRFTVSTRMLVYRTNIQKRFNVNTPSKKFD